MEIMLNVDCERINRCIITRLERHVTTGSTDTDINLQAEQLLLLLLALLTLAMMCSRPAANVLKLNCLLGLFLLLE